MFRQCAAAAWFPTHVNAPAVRAGVDNRRAVGYIFRMARQPHPRRTSHILESLIENAEGRGDISIREILDMLGNRAFGLAILVFSLPNSLPIPSPPGFSAIFGVPIILLAVQIVIGRPTPWLPRRFGGYRFSRAKFTAFLQKALPYIRKVERLLHPRLSFMESWLGERVIGIALALLAVVLAMPIPFGNFLPGLSMSLIALGMLERDGALALAGILGGVLATVFIFTAIDIVAGAAFDLLRYIF